MDPCYGLSFQRMQLADHFIALVIPLPLDGPMPEITPGGWTKAEDAPDPAFTEHLKQKYYTHFLSTMHPGILPASETVRRTYSSVDPVVMAMGSVSFKLHALELLCVDPSLGLVTVLLKLEGPGSVDDLNRIAGAVREPSTPTVLRGATRSLIDHLVGFLSTWSITKERLLAFGPNFKVFVNAVLQQESLNDEEWDDHLFELATGLPQGGMTEAFAPTTSYRSEQVARHGIKVFRNWRALALFDTFTRLAVKSEDPHRSWEHDYLRVFQYVHLLRAQSLALSSRLGGMALSDVALLDQRDRWMELRNNVDLTFVSYKWLPNELFSHMVKGTNTLHEIHRADERLERMVQRFKERRARNLTRVGLVMLGLIIVLLFAFSDLV